MTQNLDKSRRDRLVASGGVEQVDDRVRTFCENRQRLDDWLAKSKKSLIEKYIDGDIDLVLIKARRTPIAGVSDYGIVFKSWPNGEKIDSPIPGWSRDNESGGLPANIDQFSMLAHDVKVVNGAKNIISSLIRFARFDMATFGSGESLYKFSPLVSTKGSKLYGVEIGGEDGVDFAFVDSAHRRFMAIKECGGENIETAADAIDDNADFSVNNGIGQFDVAKFDGVFSGLRLILVDPNFVTVRSPNLDSLCKNWELGFGPINCSFSV